MAECEHEWTVRGYVEQIACGKCGRPKAAVYAQALRDLVEADRKCRKAEIRSETEDAFVSWCAAMKTAERLLGPEPLRADGRGISIDSKQARGESWKQPRTLKPTDGREVSNG